MKRIAAALLLTFALSGCAVTGQPAPPGTAAVFDGHTVTNDEVAAWSTALTELGFANDPGETLTLLLLQPVAEKAALDDGNVLTDEEIEEAAVFWALAKGKTLTEVTDDQIAVVRTVRALATQVVPAGTDSVTFTEPVLEVIAGLEERAKVSPEYGDFSQAVFADSLASAVTEVAEYANAPGQISYLVLKNVNGFNPHAQRDWMGVEGATSEASA
ncbi:hypothetical protein LGT39_03405 [Demequina sp. TTPB684]|uniref:hypothetical protein n=1 Tax=unclassified Demequina TaxID=2620311 RepID=UPI001CF2DAE3|nr:MULTISPECIES: hypothetical protein [unclassified Demequina]MCB2411894.1 hypothetical protein [Demequina sp. TTPB684]UPU87366.1 hypothetical protein LGT36_008775 [Demequina sp. TMPB413]